MTQQNTPLLPLDSASRRTLLKSAGVVGAGLLAAAGISQNAWAGEHMNHVANHHGHDTAAKNPALAQALHACVAAAEACHNHCLNMFKMGDTSMADCAMSVSDTMAFCAAHAKLTAYDSKFLREMTTLGIKVCADCEKACRKHEKEHAVCQACANRCADCIKACQAYLG